MYILATITLWNIAEKVNIYQYMRIFVFTCTQIYTYIYEINILMHLYVFQDMHVCTYLKINIYSGKTSVNSQHIQYISH
jgi:hypothetical protein